MCGICGVISINKIEKKELLVMAGEIKHRGPDAEGSFVAQASGKWVGLGHRRLSIIDLSDTANQPMSDEDDLVIVFNGEIYNFLEIREKLIKGGYSFKTKSDTEVILKAYREWGIDFVNKLNGMFAIGLLDLKNRILYLIRDRIGIKPVFYFYKGGQLAFSSELKALFKLQNFDKEIDFVSLNDYFSLGYIPYPSTVFKNSYKLEPGHYLRYDLKTGAIKKIKYWEIDCSCRDKITDINEIKEILRGLMKDSVKKRMISDVPLGAFLSGGIDSTIVVATMAELSSKPVKTFTIGFEGEKDEREYARLTAEKYGTEHTEEILSFDNFRDIIPELIYQMDEPFADHSMIPTYLVSKYAREKVTVSLSGDGGDENFGGYVRPYMFSKYFEKYLKIPYALRFLSEKIILCPTMKFVSHFTKKKRRLYKFCEILSSRGDEQIISHMFQVTKIIKKSLYSKGFKREIEENYSPSIFTGQLNLTKEFSLPQWNMCHDLKNYMVNDILTKVDRMSMLNSLEVRVPILDHRIVEFALKIPTEYKLKGNISKWILKETFKDKIPEELFSLPKKGFGIPLKKWVKNFVRDEIVHYLNNFPQKTSIFFNEKELKNILSNKKENFSVELWTIYVFLKWAEEISLL